MAEIWGAAIAVGGSLISGYAASKKDKGDKAHEQAMTKEESALAAQRTGYEKALENFYMERQRFQKQRGLDEFRKFSTIGRWAPGYTDANARVTDPVMPTYGDFGTPEGGTTNATGENPADNVIGQRPTMPAFRIAGD